MNVLHIKSHNIYQLKSNAFTNGSQDLESLKIKEEQQADPFNFDIMSLKQVKMRPSRRTSTWLYDLPATPDHPDEEADGLLRDLDSPTLGPSLGQRGV